MRIFSRQPRPVPIVEDESPALEHPRWDGYVPASARPPELPVVAIDTEEDDADVDFLANLAAQVEMQQRKRPMSIEGERQRARLQVQTVKVDDEAKLDVFREAQRHDERKARSDQLPVPHVEMSDLLDDLETTRTALRQRRAA